MTDSGVKLWQWGCVVGELEDSLATAGGHEEKKGRKHHYCSYSSHQKWCQSGCAFLDWFANSSEWSQNARGDSIYQSKPLLSLHRLTDGNTEQWKSHQPCVFGEWEWGINKVTASQGSICLLQVVPEFSLKSSWTQYGWCGVSVTGDRHAVTPRTPAVLVPEVKLKEAHFIRPVVVLSVTVIFLKTI